jgi:hypothetical protein
MGLPEGLPEVLRDWEAELDDQGNVIGLEAPWNAEQVSVGLAAAAEFTELRSFCKRCGTGISLP